MIFEQSFYVFRVVKESFALHLNGSYHVLCADLDFVALAGNDLPLASIVDA